jgi:hypothetical protein
MDQSPMPPFTVQLFGLHYPPSTVPPLPRIGENKKSSSQFDLGFILIGDHYFRPFRFRFHTLVHPFRHDSFLPQQATW